MNPGFWKDRRVFVTGHTGFKGSWLSLWLARLGARVCGFALDPPTCPSLFESARVAGDMDSTIADIRDFSKVRAALEKSAPEIILHLAAQAIVRQSYEQPLETFATNLMGTVNLLEAARTCPQTRAIVVITSDKCYENQEWVWPYRENEPLGGHDPYSASKGCQELAAAAFRRSFFEKTGVALATARAGNVIGGGDWARDRLVPDVARAIAAGQPAKIRNAAAVRPWQHVLDPLHGYLVLCERLVENGPAFAGAWNFGPLDTGAVPVCTLADLFTRAMGHGASWKSDPPPQAVHEAHLLRLDASKARARLDWRPRLSFEESVGWTALWYKAFIAGQDLREFTTDQISRFQDRAAQN